MNVTIIGGGAGGLFLANALNDTQGVLLIERGERLGRKLSATGNGQGNITNLQATKAEYFSARGNLPSFVYGQIAKYDDRSFTDFFLGLGVSCAADERGRVYPSGKQASALTDALRYSLQNKGVAVWTETQVVGVEKRGAEYLLTLQSKGETRLILSKKVVFCTGGKAAKNFGTDGGAYALAQSLGHSVTPLYPSLVQLKTDTVHTKGLKGIRVADGGVRVTTPKRSVAAQGDIIFTDYGVSGDAIFRLSAFVADEIPSGECRLSVDFLPAFTEEQIYRLLLQKQKKYPSLDKAELLFGIVNNQVGRAIFRRAEKDIERAASLVKDFSLTVTGSLGFDYAQVTKGGIPLNEVTDRLESRFAKGVYFVGEILDVDGQCGGYNLQWAYSSARTVADELNK